MQSKVAATTPAVSLRRRFSPKVTGTNPWFKADVISVGEKSPSGPMRIKEVAADAAGEAVGMLACEGSGAAGEARAIPAGEVSGLAASAV